jgi:23S rRNA pseudouridine1911/1915/1917 synthase
VSTSASESTNPNRKVIEKSGLTIGPIRGRLFEMERLFEVIFENANLLVINKPAGLVCHPTKGDVYSSLISRVRLYLGADTFPHMINRLDRETSGIVIVAKDLESAVSLRKLWERRAVRKEYLAIVRGCVDGETRTIEARLGKDCQSCVAIKDCVRPDGVEARTDFSVERRFRREEGEFSLLRVVPWTGRKHQIRIHLSHCGHPIIGDKIYGGDESFYLALVDGRLTESQRCQLILPHHGLHACKLTIPWYGEEMVFRASPEPWFADFYEIQTQCRNENICGKQRDNSLETFVQKLIDTQRSI